MAKVVMEGAGVHDAPPSKHAPGDPVAARGIPLVVEGGIGGSVTSVAPLRTCFACGRPPRGKRRCRCSHRGIPKARAIAPRQPERAEPREEPTAVELGRAAEAAEARPLTAVKVVRLGRAEAPPETFEQATDPAAAAKAAATLPAISPPAHRGQRYGGSEGGIPRSVARVYTPPDFAGTPLGAGSAGGFAEAPVGAAPPEQAGEPAELERAVLVAQAAARLHERGSLAVAALRSTRGGLDEGLLLLERVAWPPEDDPDAELIAAAVPAWRRRYGLPAARASRPLARTGG